jgi:hypothetical protein
MRDGGRHPSTASAPSARGTRARAATARRGFPTTASAPLELGTRAAAVTARRPLQPALPPRSFVMVAPAMTKNVMVAQTTTIGLAQDGQAGRW